MIGAAEIAASTIGAAAVALLMAGAAAVASKITQDFKEKINKYLSID